jgi:hypothetical protein
MNDSPSNLVQSNSEPSASQATRHLAYGEAAVMLIECLMLVLIEQRVLSTMASRATPIAGAGHRAVIHGWTKRSFTSVENPCTFV